MLSTPSYVVDKMKRFHPIWSLRKKVLIKYCITNPFLVKQNPLLLERENET